MAPRSLQPLHTCPPVTAESIIAARLAQLRERAQVTLETGYVFPEDEPFIADELAQWEIGINYARLALGRKGH